MIEERKSRRGSYRPGAGRPLGSKTVMASPAARAIGAAVRALEVAARSLVDAADATGDQAYRAEAKTVADLAGQVRTRAIVGRLASVIGSTAGAAAAPTAL